MMKRIAILLVLASTACATSKGGARGPQIQRTDSAQPASPDTGSLDGRPELGQR